MTTADPNKLSATTGEPQDLLMAGCEALAALAVLDEYRQLSLHERDRVFAELQRAKRRDHDPEALHRFHILEDFRAVVDGLERGQNEAQLCRQSDLTGDQLTRYKAAWKTITEIHEEVEEATQ